MTAVVETGAVRPDYTSGIIVSVTLTRAEINGEVIVMGRYAKQLMQVWNKSRFCRCQRVSLAVSMLVFTTTDDEFSDVKMGKIHACVMGR